MGSMGLVWTVLLKSQVLTLQFTKYISSLPFKELQVLCVQNFRVFGTASALDLQKFSLSIGRMLCPGKTMGIMEAEKSHGPA